MAWSTLGDLQSVKVALKGQACGKTFHRSEGAAASHARALINSNCARTPERLRPYVCSLCSRFTNTTVWHVGNVPTETKG